MGPYLRQLMLVAMWALVPAGFLFGVGGTVVYRQALGVAVEVEVERLRATVATQDALKRDTTRRVTALLGRGPLTRRAERIGLRLPASEDIHLVVLTDCAPLVDAKGVPYPDGDP